MVIVAAGVPNSQDKKYGRDTVWPASRVVDANGVIRYAELSKQTSDRPDPELPLGEIELVFAFARCQA